MLLRCLKSYSLSVVVEERERRDVLGVLIAVFLLVSGHSSAELVLYRNVVQY